MEQWWCWAMGGHGRGRGEGMVPRQKGPDFWIKSRIAPPKHAGRLPKYNPDNLSWIQKAMEHPSLLSVEVSALCLNCNIAPRGSWATIAHSSVDSF